MNWTHIYPLLLVTPEAIAEREAVLRAFDSRQVEAAAAVYCAIRFGLEESGEPRSVREATEGLAASFAMLSRVVR